MTEKYVEEVLSRDEDNGTMVENVDTLRKSVVGRKIVSAGWAPVKRVAKFYDRDRTYTEDSFVITLDDGTCVTLRNDSDCCAVTELESFFLNVERIRHVITGVGTTEGYTKWHIYAEMGDILQLNVRWSCGNPFYYGYGFNIEVQQVTS